MRKKKERYWTPQDRADQYLIFTCRTLISKLKVLPSCNPGCGCASLTLFPSWELELECSTALPHSSRARLWLKCILTAAQSVQSKPGPGQLHCSFSSNFYLIVSLAAVPGYIGYSTFPSYISRRGTVFRASSVTETRSLAVHISLVGCCPAWHSLLYGEDSKYGRGIEFPTIKLARQIIILVKHQNVWNDKKLNWNLIFWPPGDKQFRVPNYLALHRF